MSSSSSTPTGLTKAVSIEGEASESGSDESRGVLEFFGWVYHLGVNSIGHVYCHLRFLFVKGKYVEMYKRDPHENPGIKPIRKGVVGHTLMVEELGRRRVNHGDLYVVRFSNRLDETRKGEIACSSAGEARKWMEAFDHAKQQAEYELSRGASARHKLNMENELNLGHQPRVRRYAKGLRKLVRIGQGPEQLLHQSSNLGANFKSDGHYGTDDVGDAVEAHEWKCVRTINGIRVLEDVSEPKVGSHVIVKAVAVIEANLDTVFEVVLSLEQRQRYEWDMLTGNLELVDSLNGHYDVVYGTHEPNYLSRWHSKMDFVFSRQWFREQDGAYTILQFPIIHKKRPPKPGYRRIDINRSTWEIRHLNTCDSNSAKCLVALMLEIDSSGWRQSKKLHCSKFEKSVPYALLSQVAGLKEYFGANPALTWDSPTIIIESKLSNNSSASNGYEDPETSEEFYDAIAAEESSDDEDSDDDIEETKNGKVKLKNVSWAIASLKIRRRADTTADKEFDEHISPITIDASLFHGSMRKGKDETDTNCWTSPGGQGFMIRGKTYLKDDSKVVGGDPLLQLLAVDWFKASQSIDKVALNPKCLVQTKAGKELPFILLINLMVPANPNYSMVLYYGADRPIKKDSLLGRFVDGTDMFRDARFKIIPSIVEGYWMVKRAVGRKACLLGKAVTCNYVRQDNFLEIDVDIGSSSVAKSIIGLVLGYVTSLVVDLAFLVEAKEEAELPEHILGTVRLSRVNVDSAVSFQV